MKIKIRAILDDDNFMFYQAENEDNHFMEWNQFCDNHPLVFVNEKEHIAYPFEWVMFDDDWIKMLWTGEKDRDGEDIYEGDIVVFYDSLCRDSEVAVYTTVIDFYRGSFGCEKGHYYLYEMLDCYSVKKIGNIYENPELLKKGGK